MTKEKDKEFFQVNNKIIIFLTEKCARDLSRQFSKAVQMAKNFKMFTVTCNQRKAN